MRPRHRPLLLLKSVFVKNKRLAGHRWWRSSRALDPAAHIEQVLAALPGRYLVVRANPPTFSIVGVSDDFLQATVSVRQELIGRPLFEVFPANPLDEMAKDGHSELARSFELVIESKLFQALPVQRPGGASVARISIEAADQVLAVNDDGRAASAAWWNVTNYPILNRWGRVGWIVHVLTDGQPPSVPTSSSSSSVDQRPKQPEPEIPTIPEILVGGRPVRALMAERLIDLASDAFIVRDLLIDGGHIRFWSRGAERLYGYSSSQAVGQSIHHLLKTRYLDGVDVSEVIGQMTEIGEWEGRLEHTTASGAKILVYSIWTKASPSSALEVNSAMVVEGGGLTMSLALEVNRDITQVVALEAERAARIEAEVALRARDEFLAIAAHELKTPLTSLLGFAEVLTKDVAIEVVSGHGDRRARIARSAHQIAEAGRRLNRLVEQLLEVGRLGQGETTLRPQELEMDELVELATQVVIQAQAEYWHRELEFFFPPHPTPHSVWVLVDPKRLEQVLENLIDNAVRFAPSGVIGVGVGPIEEDGWVSMWVSDSGPGIPESLRERVFERAFQAEPHTAEAGLGLGLYIADQVVKLHGGSIRISTGKEGKGTQVSVRLPIIGKKEKGEGEREGER